MAMTVHIDGLHPAIQVALAGLLADPVARQHGVYVISAYRSPDEQKALYDAAVAKYGAANAGKWVAPPWHSNHGPTRRDDGSRVPYGPNQGGKWGGAIDFGIPNVVADSNGQWPSSALAWFDPLAAKHGFVQVMAWEDWHREPGSAFDFTVHVPPARAGEDDMPTVVAQDVQMNPAKPGQGYVLDSQGGIHPVGGAPGATGGPSWPLSGDGAAGPARRLAITDWAKPSGYVLDALGALHPFGGAPAVADAPYWKNAFVPPAAQV